MGAHMVGRGGGATAPWLNNAALCFVFSFLLYSIESADYTR